MNRKKMIFTGFLFLLVGCDERTYTISYEDDFINYSSCSDYRSEYLDCLESATTPSSMADCEKIEDTYETCVSANADTETATDSSGTDTNNS